jgi:predicted lipoprotein with Yx(FWY)xxD motif
MRNSSKLTRWAGPAWAALLAVMLVACGSDDSSDSAGTSGAGSGTVSVSDVSGLGDVLVDGSGKTLYFSDQESDGTIMCTDACLGFWTPAEASGKPPSDINGLSVITRDDNGAKQLAFDGAPLYTFSLDRGPGQANGDELTDAFGGTSFTWHAAVTEQSATSDTSGDTGDNTGGNGSGYQNPYDY